ncbi:MAG: CHAT domain-containing tetratricopeptide repeat protein [Bacteroidota bacterium]
MKATGTSQKAKLLILGLCFPVFLIAQYSQADSLRIEALNGQIDQLIFTDYPLALNKLDTLIELSDQVQAWPEYLSANLLKVSAANIYQEFQTAEQQIAFCETEFARLEAQLGDQRANLQGLLFSTKAEYFYVIGRFLESLEYYKASNALLEPLVKDQWEVSQNLLANYQFIAELNQQFGNLREAVEYNEASLQYFPKEARGCSSNRSTLYRNLGELHEAMGDLELAKDYYLNAVEEIQYGVEACDFFPAYLNNVILAVYESAALFYAEHGPRDSAAYYLEMLDSYPITADAKYYDYLANIQLETGAFNLAKANAQTAILQKEKTFGNRHFEMGQSLLILGQIEAQLGNNNTALDYYQKALISLSENFQSQNIQDNPSIEEVFSDQLFLKTINAKLSALLEMYKASPSLEWVEAALATSKTGLNLLDDMRLRSGNDEDRQSLSEQSYALFEHGLTACYELYQRLGEDQYLAEAFRISEKSKAFNLLAAYRNAQARSVTGLPEAFANKEYSLRAELQQLRETLYDARQAENLPESAIAEAQELALQKQSEYRELIETIRAQHPEYYALRYDASVVPLEDVKAQLAEGTALLTYFTGESKGYLLLITSDTQQLIALGDMDTLLPQVNNLIRGLQDQDMTTFTGTANALFEALCSPLKALENIDQLLIVPDGALGYLPFEILLSQQPSELDFRTLPYLLKQYTIRYAYSATLLPFAAEDPKPGKLLAFAPSFSAQQVQVIPELAMRQQVLDSLLYNQQESEQVRSITKGRVLKGKSAQLTRFIEQAADYPFLHLASHGKVDDQEPRYSFIAFSPEAGQNNPELLFMRDLYSLDLNAQMVVLSACQTGIGKYARGEGLQSMARAFAYAGAESIVTTLWSVNDKSTMQLMAQFYQHLSEGQSKDEALRQAKLDFLADSDAFESNPFNWAAFIPIGDMRPVAFQSARGRMMWWLAGLGVLIILVVGWRMKA